MANRVMLIVCVLIYLVYGFSLRSLPWSAQQWGVLILAINLPLFAAVARQTLKTPRTAQASGESEDDGQFLDVRTAGPILGMALFIALFSPRLGFVIASVASLPVTMWFLGARRPATILLAMAGVFLFLQFVIVGIFQVPLNG